MQCDYCGTPIEGYPFKCAYCGGSYCGEHRVPETHRCVVSRQAMNVPSKASARERGKWSGSRRNQDQGQVPTSPYRRRRWGYRSSGHHRWLRVRRAYVFLLIWGTGFGLGLYLVPALSYPVIIGISLFNAAVVSVFLYGVLGIRHRGFGHKAFSVLLMLVLVGFMYQNPTVLNNINSSSVSALYSTEASYVSAIPGGAQGVVSNLSPPLVNAKWAREFFGNLSSIRETGGTVGLTENQQLDSFAGLRFSDLAAHYQITHYNYDSDFTSYFGAYSGLAGTEEYFYPSGYSPADYINYLRQSAPAHYQGLVDGTYSHYGFYIGSGPVYNVNQGCPVSEIVGSVNQTQFFQQNGCSFSIGTTTWLVVELSS